MHFHDKLYYFIRFQPVQILKIVRRFSVDKASGWLVVIDPNKNTLIIACDSLLFLYLYWVGVL